jgi:hypothetical protein
VAKGRIADPGATDAWLTLTAVTGSAMGQYSVTATNSAGTVISNGAMLTVIETPVFTQHPAGQTVTVGDSVLFVVAATGVPTPALQWLKNGIAIPGATSSTLRLDAITMNDSGTYSVIAKNSAGSATSNSAVLQVQEAYVPPPPPPPAPEPTPPPPPPPEPVSVAQLANQMFDLEMGGRRNVSFVVGGDVTRKILVRAVGPSLSALGITGALSDPYFQVFQGRLMLYQNDNWGGSSELMQAFSQAGALPFISVKSTDAALLIHLPPGIYSVLVGATNGLAGTVMVEVFEFR